MHTVHVLWTAGCISQSNKGSLDHLSFTWQQQTAETAETCWVTVGKR